MGNILGSYYERLMSLFEKKANILMLGLDSIQVKQQYYIN